MEDEQKITKELNAYYINIVKTAFGKPPVNLENNFDYIHDMLITKQINKKYKNYPSRKAMQDTFPVKKEFKIVEAKAKQVNNILRNINSRKATRPDKIPPKNIINSNLKGAEAICVEIATEMKKCFGLKDNFNVL